eukprot:gene11722-8067_t
MKSTKFISGLRESRKGIANARESPTIVAGSMKTNASHGQSKIFLFFFVYRSTHEKSLLNPRNESFSYILLDEIKREKIKSILEKWRQRLPPGVSLIHYRSYKHVSFTPTIFLTTCFTSHIGPFKLEVVDLFHTRFLIDSYLSGVRN